MAEPLDLPFSREEYRDRLSRVQKEMARLGLDLLLVHTPENNYYLTGYRTIGYYSYTCLFVPAGGDPLHLNRFIEKSVVEGTSWVARQEVYPDTEHYLDATVRVLTAEGFARARIGIDKSAWYFTISDYEQLRARLPAATFVDAAGLVERLRLIKSPAEQAYSRGAGVAVSRAMRATLDAIREGVTENDLMAVATGTLYREGSEFTGLPPLINAGPRHTMAHATAEGRPIARGDGVYLEMAASIKRYHAACLRSAWVGPPPSEIQKLVDLCRRALEAGLSWMRPGTPAQDVDHACRRVIEEAGYGDKFRHKAGYSLGIALPPDWSEARALMLRGGEKRELEPGMIFHILPAVFEYGEYGVGVSGTVLITPTGHEVLTDVEERLFVIP